jgi:DNA-binding LacI/PurR family transcriptional regulator
MNTLPRRSTLVEQLTAILRQEIASGTWTDWLPSERSLSERLQVSRNTLRSALESLSRDGIIRTAHGAGNRILVQQEKPSARATREVVVLTPDPLHQLRPTLALWIEELGVQLRARGIALRVLHGRQYFRARPAPALHRLVRQHRGDCWILLLGSEPLQRWFAASGLPCVVAGTVFPGIDLPCCAADHHSMCSRIAHLLVAKGHRRIALLVRRSGLAADLQSELGFRQAIAATPENHAEAIVCHHDDTVMAVTAQVGQLMRRALPPTALLVTNAHYYLTVASCLQKLGKQIWRDVSVVSRTDDRFLSFVVPEPARYTVSPSAMARGLLPLVIDLLAGRKIRHRSVMVLPEFHPGESVGPPPAVG